MVEELEPQTEQRFDLKQRAIAYGVHLYTALGLICAALTGSAILDGKDQRAFCWMMLAVIIDSTDGTLARKYRVKEVVPQIDGRKLDDIVDYLNYTFLPLFMIGQAGWLPEPDWLWIGIALVASVFGFSNVGAKEEENGFFLGFPSYWNIFAFYTAVWLQDFGSWFVLVVLLTLSLLSVLPVRFVYPNRPPKWRPFFVGGGLAWMTIIVWMIYKYPDISNGLLALSLIYPIVYIVLSVYLDVTSRPISAGAVGTEDK